MPLYLVPPARPPTPSHRPTFCAGCGHPISKGSTRCRACVGLSRKGVPGWDDPIPERQWSASGERRRVSVAEVLWIQAHVGAVSVGVMAERLGLSRATVTAIRTGKHRLCRPEARSPGVISLPGTTRASSSSNRAPGPPAIQTLEQTMPSPIDINAFAHACLVDLTVLTGRVHLLRRHASAQAPDRERSVQEMDTIDLLHKRLTERITDYRDAATTPPGGG